ncbi:glutamate ligase domain-containing protein, partial [Bifidobacterium tsurumiense]
PTTTFALRTSAVESPVGASTDAPSVVAYPATEADGYVISNREPDGSVTTMGPITLDIEGDFNYANAAAAIAIGIQAGVDFSSSAGKEALRVMQRVRVPGRMEQFTDPVSSALAIVDYAHNRLSVNALLDFVEKRYSSRNPHIILVTGSAGNKALERREQIVSAAQDRIDRFIFTAEDTDSEPYLDICKDMARHVSNTSVKSDIIVDRTQAVEAAVEDAREHRDRFTIILIIGKGDERWIKDANQHTAYEGDDRLIQRLFSYTPVPQTLSDALS